jgi:transcriptional regulator with XRE-family HTH domain
MKTTPDERARDELYRRIGARMQQIRTERTTTQAQVAEAADVAVQTYQRAESGRTRLSLWKLSVLAHRGLGVKLVDLLADVETSIPDSEIDPEQLRVLNAWSGIPSDQRDLALRMLREFNK